MDKRSHLLILGLVWSWLPVHAESVDEMPIGEAVERHLLDDVAPGTRIS